MHPVAPVHVSLFTINSRMHAVKRLIGLAMSVGLLMVSSSAMATPTLTPVPKGAAASSDVLTPAEPTANAIGAQAVASPALPSPTFVGTVATNMSTAPPIVPRTPMVEKTNWSGYINVAKRGIFFNEAWTYWVVPKFTCRVHRIGRNGSMAGQWVGIDGSSGSATVEQEGTAVDCLFNRSHTRLEGITTMWWEMFPRPPHQYVGVVRPGDRIGAVTRYVGNNKFQLYIKDFNNGNYINTTQACPKTCYLHTTEAVNELPGKGVAAGVTLTKTGRFPFYNFYNTVYNSFTRTDFYGYLKPTVYWGTKKTIIGDPSNHWRTLDTIGSLYQGGRAFDVFWKHGF
jgi:Peptidase A4 family